MHSTISKFAGATLTEIIFALAIPGQLSLILTVLGTLVVLILLGVPGRLLYKHWRKRRERKRQFAQLRRLGAQYRKRKAESAAHTEQLQLRQADPEWQLQRAQERAKRQRDLASQRLSRLPEEAQRLFAQACENMRATLASITEARLPPALDRSRQPLRDLVAKYQPEVKKVERRERSRVEAKSKKRRGKFKQGGFDEFVEQAIREPIKGVAREFDTQSQEILQRELERESQDVLRVFTERHVRQELEEMTIKLRTYAHDLFGQNDQGLIVDRSSMNKQIEERIVEEVRQQRPPLLRHSQTLGRIFRGTLQQALAELRQDLLKEAPELMAAVRMLYENEPLEDWEQDQHSEDVEDNVEDEEEREPEERKQAENLRRRQEEEEENADGDEQQIIWDEEDEKKQAKEEEQEQREREEEEREEEELREEEERQDREDREREEEEEWD